MTCYAVMIGRFLLGFIFLAAGVNGMLVFFGLEPLFPTSPEAMAFFSLEYLLFLEKMTEVVCGLLLLLNRWVPLALNILAPLVVNIFFFHLFVDPRLLPLAIVLATLHIFLLWTYRRSFYVLLQKHAKDHGKEKIRQSKGA